MLSVGGLLLSPCAVWSVNVTPPLCVPQHSSNPVSSGGHFDIDIRNRVIQG